MYMWKIVALQKMPLLYLPVIIVLSISVANVVSESQVGTSGLTDAPLSLHPHLIAGAHHVSRGHSVWQSLHSASLLIPLSP